MTNRGVHLAAKRGVSYAIGIAAVALIGAWPIWAVPGLAALGVAVYLAWPAPAPPADALGYARGPAVIGPDLLGFAMVAFFAGLPFVAGRSEGAVLHPSLALTWPMAALFLSLPVIGWRREVFALRLTPEGIEIDRGTGPRAIAYGEVVAVRPWRRDLLRSARRLVPFLVGTGQFGTAGALMVARESRGVALELGDGETLVIPGDGFEQGLKRLLGELAAHGITPGASAGSAS